MVQTKVLGSSSVAKIFRGSVLWICGVDLWCMITSFGLVFTDCLWCGSMDDISNCLRSSTFRSLSPLVCPFPRSGPVNNHCQVLSVRHPQKGTLELGFTIVVPPGRLGQFTKVVQFWPRLLVVNRLPQALVLEQNSTLRYVVCPISSLQTNYTCPTHMCS